MNIKEQKVAHVRKEKIVVKSQLCVLKWKITDDSLYTTHDTERFNSERLSTYSWFQPCSVIFILLCKYSCIPWNLPGVFNPISNSGNLKITGSWSKGRSSNNFMACLWCSKFQGEPFVTLKFFSIFWAF